MTTARDFINRHPVATYFVLMLGIAWGGIRVVAGADGVPATAEEFERVFPLVVLALFAGPSLAGLLLASLAHGPAARRELLWRLLTARLDAHWYTVGDRASGPTGESPSKPSTNAVQEGARAA